MAIVKILCALFLKSSELSEHFKNEVNSPRAFVLLALMRSSRILARFTLCVLVSPHFSSEDKQVALLNMANWISFFQVFCYVLFNIYTFSLEVTNLETPTYYKMLIYEEFWNFSWTILKPWYFPKISLISFRLYKTYFSGSTCLPIKKIKQWFLPIKRFVTMWLLVCDNEAYNCPFW